MENYSIILQLLWACYKKLKLDDEEVLENKDLQKHLKNYLINNGKYIINKIYVREDIIYLIPMSENAQNFAFDQLQNWVDKLIISLSMRKNVDYIIDEEKKKIDPVDKDITGVISKTMIYENGLSAFLEMQNNLQVPPISINTNYLSNLGLFQRYIKDNSNYIFGVTGTLGSKETIKLLENIYHVDFDFIPPNKMRKLKELDSNLCFSQSSLIENVFLTVRREINGNRSILIICQNIKLVNEIYEYLKKKLLNIKIIKVIGINDDEHLIPDNIEPKTIIISTNISGRGTNLKISKEVIDNFGLHVIITFIPNNIRVEEQNFGRAGRQGEPGTCQLLINIQDFFHKNMIKFENFKDFYIKYQELVQQKERLNDPIIKKACDFFSIEYLRNIRKEKENKEIKFSYKLIKKVNLEDKLFFLYCESLKEKNELRDDDNKIYLNSIEEQWSIFLYNLDTKEEDWDKIKNEFFNFKNKIFKEFEQKDEKKIRKIIKNPGFCNQYVNFEFNDIATKRKKFRILDEIIETIKVILDKDDLNLSFKNYDKYFDLCELSIKLSYKNSFIPYYLKGLCGIFSQKKDNIMKDFEKSLSIINTEIQRYAFIFKILQNLDVNAEFPLSQLFILTLIKKGILENIKGFKNRFIRYFN